MIETKLQTQLVEAAAQARKNAYAPYSNYLVGAALLTPKGEIYSGCNVENASYPASTCAERTAVLKAVSEGKRDFVAMAVVTHNRGAPCGFCRQVMREFAPDMTVILADHKGETEVFSLAELLPRSYGPDDLK